MSKSQETTGVSMGTLRDGKTLLYWLLWWNMLQSKWAVVGSSKDYISLASVTSAISCFISIPEFRWLKIPVAKRNKPPHLSTSLQLFKGRISTGKCWIVQEGRMQEGSYFHGLKGINIKQPKQKPAAGFFHPLCRLSFLPAAKRKRSALLFFLFLHSFWTAIMFAGS